jgi:UV excision repair protein RAD23
LSAILDNSQLQQLREAVGSNPAAIQPLIQQLATSNPQLAVILAQHPELLFQVLSGGDGNFDFDEGGDPPSNVHEIHVTEEERAAIERVRIFIRNATLWVLMLLVKLEALGFPRRAVIEAYFACDKNEELAANYLFEGGFED